MWRPRYAQGRPRACIAPARASLRGRGVERARRGSRRATRRCSRWIMKRRGVSVTASRGISVGASRLTASKAWSHSVEKIEPRSDTALLSSTVRSSTLSVPADGEPPLSSTRLPLLSHRDPLLVTPILTTLAIRFRACLSRRNSPSASGLSAPASQTSSRPPPPAPLNSSRHHRRPEGPSLAMTSKRFAFGGKSQPRLQKDLSEERWSIVCTFNEPVETKRRTRGKPSPRRTDSFLQMSSLSLLSNAFSANQRVGIESLTHRIVAPH